MSRTLVQSNAPPSRDGLRNTINYWQQMWGTFIIDASSTAPCQWLTLSCNNISWKCMKKPAFHFPFRVFCRWGIPRPYLATGTYPNRTSSDSYRSLSEGILRITDNGAISEVPMQTVILIWISNSAFHQRPGSVQGGIRQAFIGSPPYNFPFSLNEYEWYKLFAFQGDRKKIIIFRFAV